MDEADMAVTRRTMFLAGGLGALALVAAGSAPAAESGVTEKANIQLVKDFCKSWSDDPPDPEKMAGQFLAEDCVVRFGETIAPVSGQTAAVELFQSFLNNGERYDLKIVDSFARGPIVVNARVDSTLKGTRITNPTKVVGVFLVRDGKIKEWSDYV